MHRFRKTSGLASGVLALALVAAACAPYDATTEAVIEPVGADASVRGTITYRERIALSPDAVVTVQLRDTSYADAAAVLIDEQIISNPGQVPIDFNLRYASDEIDNRNTYSVSAVITEGDGRMAFTNDTAYDVITRGNPRRVDMTLVMVEPPPELAPEGWSPTDPERVEAPVHVTDVEMLWESRTTSQSEGNRYEVTVTALVPAELPWAQDCSELDLELDAVVYIGEVASDETVEVTVNGEHEYSFTAP